MPALLRSRIWLSFVAVCCAAQTKPAVQIDDLIKEMLARNPAIRAAQFRLDAATKRPSQLSTLPDPKLSFTNFGVGHPFSPLGNSDFAYQSFGFSQEFPYPGKLGLAGEQAKKEAESERQMYRTAVQDAVAQLKSAYFEWFGVSKAIEITGKNRELLRQIERIARARYSVGKGQQQDVLKAQVEESTIAQQLEMLNQRKMSIEARIQSLVASDIPLNRPADVKLSALTQTLEALLATLPNQSPRLKSKEAVLDSRAVGIKRSKKDYRPDFGVSFQWLKTGAPFSDYYMATAEMKVPLYFWRKQRLGVEESVARFQEARHDYLAERQEQSFQVKDLYFIAKTSERLIALYQEGVIPQSALSLESSLAAYETGTVDFLTVLNSFLTAATYEMQYYEELAKHQQAMARLEALVAMPLIQSRGNDE